MTVEIAISYAKEYWYMIALLLILFVNFRCSLKWHAWKKYGKTERDGIYTNYYKCRYCDKEHAKEHWGES